MDVLVPGVGEIIGGSQREERLDVLEARMKEQELDPSRLLVVSRPAALRHGAALGLRPGPGADGAVRHRHGQHPRRDSVPAHAGQRGVLNRQFHERQASISTRLRRYIPSNRHAFARACDNFSSRVEIIAKFAKCQIVT